MVCIKVMTLLLNNRGKVVPTVTDRLQLHHKGPKLPLVEIEPIPEGLKPDGISFADKIFQRHTAYDVHMMLTSSTLTREVIELQVQM